MRARLVPVGWLLSVLLAACAPAGAGGTDGGGGDAAGLDATAPPTLDAGRDDDAGSMVDRDAGGMVDTDAGGMPDDDAGGMPGDDAGGMVEGDAGGMPDDDAGGMVESDAGGMVDIDAGAPARCGDGVVTVGEACDDGNGVDTDDCTNDCTLGDCALDPVGPTCGYVHDAPRTTSTDFSYLYRPTNHRPNETWPVASALWHLRAGEWAAEWNEQTATFAHFGRTPTALAYGDREADPAAAIGARPALRTAFAITRGSARATADGFWGTGRDATHRSRIVEGGRFLNRLWTPTVEYGTDTSVRGEIELAAMPRHVVLTHRVRSDAWPASPVGAEVRLGGDAIAGLDLDAIDWRVPGRVARVTDGAGVGLLIAVQEVAGASSSLVREGNELVARRVWAVPTAGLVASVSVVVVPVAGARESWEALYEDPAAVSVRYQLLDRAGASVGAGVVAAWDETLGAYRVPLGTLRASGAPGTPDWTMDATHTWYGRHRLVIDSALPAPAPVPLVMGASPGLVWNITGGVPIVRDEAGVSLGWPLQASKNWHAGPDNFFRVVAHPTFVAAGPVTVELTMASARWGRPWAASHAQLSLVGWSAAGGRWDESAIGCFGESVTFDPDQTLQRAMMDDVRPVLVRSDRAWSWTGNVGGADFLQYRDVAHDYWARRLQGVRVTQDAPGPLLTDVRYEGVSSDGRIQGSVRVRLAASDDLVRQFMDFRYTFLSDVDYTRLAFFQVAADNYSDNGFAHVAWGNVDGVTGSRDVTDHRTTGYASDGERGIPVPGAEPWVMLYDNRRVGETLPEEFADLGFVIRDYEARVGDTVVTEPHINVRQSNNGRSQLGVEVGLPDEPMSAWCGASCAGRARFVPAGSTVAFTVEYVVLPADPTRYYGPSDWIRALPPSAFRSPAMMTHVAREGAVTVEAHRGVRVGDAPVTVTADRGPVAAEFTLTGGLGFVPVTVVGLPRPDGWVLEREAAGSWTPEPVEVEGGDGVQSFWDPVRAHFALTWSVPNRGRARYRVRWQP